MKFILTSILAILFTLTGYSQCRDLAQYQYNSMENVFRDYNYSLRDTYTYGQLGKGQQDVFSRKFWYGNSYALGVIGDSNTKDIDLYVYDSNFNLIAKESSTKDVSVITFTPRYTGYYYIKVKMYDAYRSSCWTLVYGYSNLLF